MRHRFLSSILVLVAVLCYSLTIFAQASAPTNAKSANEAIYSGKHHEGLVSPHDLSGVWMVSENFRFSPIHEPPNSFLQPWALAKLNAEPMALRKDLPGGHAGGETALGKDEDISCSQISLTDFITKQKPIEIVQTPQRIFMFFEYSHTFREIWMDGRALPKDPDPSYFGNSVGRWEGDTLVVETVGFNDQTVINGMPHSDAVHLVERYTRPNLDTLELSLTATDSKAYTKPWTAGPVKLAWHPDWELVEAFCIQEDNTAFKKSIIDSSWAHGQAPDSTKADKKSDLK
ncbi:MAG: hypothetical protein WCA19_11685 [Candidatus Acidiferrales bacterium]